MILFFIAIFILLSTYPILAACIQGSENCSITGYFNGWSIIIRDITNYVFHLLFIVSVFVNLGFLLDKVSSYRNKRGVVSHSSDNWDFDAWMDEEVQVDSSLSNLVVGDKVIHRARLALGQGTLMVIHEDDTCDVEFSGAKFSGISLAAVCSSEQLERERKAEAQKQRNIEIEKELQCQNQIKLVEKQNAELARKKQEQEELAKLDHQKRIEQQMLEREKELRLARENEKRKYEEKKKTISDAFARYGVKSLWHMTHQDNLENILSHGLLNHDDAVNFRKVDISEDGVQRRRWSLHKYVPLYIKPKNPMLYSRKEKQDNICLLEISLEALVNSNFKFTDGNAASDGTKQFEKLSELHLLPWDVLMADSWTEFQDGKRKKCAEVLVENRIEPQFIQAIHVRKNAMPNGISGFNIPVYHNPHKFF